VFDVASRFGDRWQRLLRFVQEVRQELAKVTWPTQREAFTYVVVVMVTVVVLTALVFALDLAFNRLVVTLFSSG
jgi:preprotein translocase subunit SecE